MIYVRTFLHQRKVFVPLRLVSPSNIRKFALAPTNTSFVCVCGYGFNVTLPQKKCNLTPAARLTVHKRARTMIVTHRPGAAQKRRVGP